MPMPFPRSRSLLQIGCRRPLLAAALAASALAASAAPPHHALREFDASGPVRLAFDQVAAVCATNYGRDTESILLAVVDATPGANTAGILAAQQSLVAPQQTACVYLAGASLQALGPNASVVGLIVDNGVVEQGVIRQGIGVGGGGCIGSLQVQDAQTRKAALLAAMLPHSTARGD